MNLYVIGVNCKATPIEIREKFNIAREEHEGLLSSINKLGGISECALLSTCHRTELHIYTGKPLSDTGFIESCLCDWKGMDIRQVKKYFYVYEGMGAIRHFLKLASGMDSVILGEDQILGQFKKAYGISMEQGASKAVLNTLSRLAITYSKKIKTKGLAIGKASTVAGQAAVLLKEIFNNQLHGKRVLVIGSGETGSMAARELMRHGVVDVYMTKRNRDGIGNTGEKESGIKLVPYEDRYMYAVQCDIIIGATASPHYTVTRDGLERIMETNRKKRIFIDLAVPRDFDESIGGLEGVCLYNIDDLKNLSFAEDKKEALPDMEFIEQQFQCFAGDFIRWFNYRNCVFYRSEV